MKIKSLIFGLILSLFISHRLCLAERDKQKYISIAPSATEILFALGLNDEIIGVSSSCDYPLDAQSKEKIGTFSQPNIEKIVSLKPDYIFCTGLEQEHAVDQLKRLNLKVYVGDPCNMQELFKSISDIGKLTNKEKEADLLIKNMKEGIAEINLQVEKIPQEKRLKVFIEVYDEPLFTAGKGSFIDELITLAGGINIAHDTKRSYSIFSSEQVIKRNPDCIIVTYMDKEKPLRILQNRLGWKEIKAVKNNRIYNDIDPNILLRPGPRTVSGLKEIYKKLYR